VKLYHAGFRGKIARSTLADANEHRDWRIYADFAHVLIAVAKRLYANDGFAVELDATAYAFDSTTIDLCLSLFPGAFSPAQGRSEVAHAHRPARQYSLFYPHFRRQNARCEGLGRPGVGAWCLLHHGPWLHRLCPLVRLHATVGLLHRTRQAEHGLCSAAVRFGRQVDRLRSDQKITLQGPKTAQQYPDALRRITYRDAETHKRFTFLTNNWTLPALTIARLDKCRWQVELFFKWIKQHLRIKAFYGTSQNAVKTQVWIAISVYVLVAIVKKELRLERSLYAVLQVLSVALFEKTPICEALLTQNHPNENTPSSNQLSLFDL